MQHQLKRASKVIYASWFLLVASVIAMLATIIGETAVWKDAQGSRIFFEQITDTPLVLIPYLGGIILIILALALPALSKLEGSKIAAVGGFLAIIYFFVLPYLVP